MTSNYNEFTMCSVNSLTTDTQVQNTIHSVYHIMHKYMCLLYFHHRSAGNE